MKYYIIAGEASGDLHGSHLIKAIHQEDAQAQVRCWGGDRMQQAGATLVKHYRELAFMGFVEVALHLRTIFKNLSFCKKDIATFQPDVVVLIDYPGFNLRIADWAKKQGMKVAYYIAPQVWAWKESRVATIKRSVDKMLVILPFEQAFFKKHHYDTIYTGHPLTEVIAEELQKPPVTVAEKTVIAILPGSRRQEIKTKLPLMLTAVKHFPEYQFVIAQAPGQDAALYQPFITGQGVQLMNEGTYHLLRQAKAALVTSGTATLETALFGVPQVVCYKGNYLSYLLAKQLIKVKYISLVNLVLDQPCVKELIQNHLNEQQIKQALGDLLHNPETQDRIQLQYTKLWELLGKRKAATTASKEIVALASSGH